jgi:hypothetical protein
MNSASNIKLKKLTTATPVSDDRGGGDEAQPGGEAVFAVGGGRLLRPDQAELKGRPEERQGVHHDGVRPAQRLHEQPADGRAAEKGKRPAPVDQRLAVDILVALHDRHEQRPVGHGEQHG